VRAFADADQVVVSQVANLEQIPENERLNPEKLIDDLRVAEKVAEYLPDVDSIVAHVAKNSATGDVICVLSNGGFERIHEKLLGALEG
jgi:UDP-N-acetylmuramate: L-alanyl-gamma-D-glutamyl-meso-diaminopimelate ligase